jgi:hypothetical protein
MDDRRGGTIRRIESREKGCQRVFLGGRDFATGQETQAPQCAALVWAHIRFRRVDRRWLHRDTFFMSPLVQFWHD